MGSNTIIAFKFSGNTNWPNFASTHKCSYCCRQYHENSEDSGIRISASNNPSFVYPGHIFLCVKQLWRWLPRQVRPGAVGTRCCLALGNLWLPTVVVAVWVPAGGCPGVSGTVPVCAMGLLEWQAMLSYPPRLGPWLSLPGTVSELVLL